MQKKKSMGQANNVDAERTTELNPEPEVSKYLLRISSGGRHWAWYLGCSGALDRGSYFQVAIPSSRVSLSVSRETNNYTR